MTDKEKLHQILSSLWKNDDSIGKTYYNQALQDVQIAIDSLQEDSVSEELDEAGKEWLRPQLDKSYEKYGENKMMELTHFDGYSMLEAIEFGAKWKEEQLMKNAVECEYFDGSLFRNDLREKYRDGDKVKIVIVKSK